MNNNVDKYKESIRFIRTNISHKSINNRIIVITSCIENKSKSELAYFLSKSFADNGNDAVLLDFDFRKEELSELISADSDVIVDNFFKNEIDIKSTLVKEKDCDKLDILNTGISLAKSSEILDSKYIKELVDKFREKYDYVIVNTPPVGIYADASIVSNIADGVIIAVKSNSATNEDLLRSVDNLRKVNANIIGVVLTDKIK